MKPPVVYPVSADLSALLGAAVDADAAWVTQEYFGGVLVAMRSETSSNVSERNPEYGSGPTGIILKNGGQK